MRLNESGYLADIIVLGVFIVGYELAIKKEFADADLCSRSKENTYCITVNAVNIFSSVHYENIVNTHPEIFVHPVRLVKHDHGGSEAVSVPVSVVVDLIVVKNSEPSQVNIVFLEFTFP